MSEAARWANTAKATWWALSSRTAGTRVPTYAAPVLIACDYGTESAPMFNEAGDPIAVNMSVHTEEARIKIGDMLMIGVSALADPAAAGAREVRAKARYADTFDRLKDDYKYGTI